MTPVSRCQSPTTYLSPSAASPMFDAARGFCLEFDRSPRNLPGSDLDRSGRASEAQRCVATTAAPSAAVSSGASSQTTGTPSKRSARQAWSAASRA